MANMQFEIDRIRNQYPWALDTAVEQIGYVVGDDIKSTIATLKAKGKANEELVGLTNEFLKDTKRMSTSKYLWTESTYAIKSFMGETNPLKGTVVLIEKFSPLLMTVGTKTLGVVGSGGIFTKMFGKVLSGTNAMIGAVAGGLYVYSDLITEHVKSTRVMIDYGIAVGNLNIYTDMRESFGTVGMSINEGLNAYKSFMPAFANLEQPITSNILSMTQFASALSQNLDFGNKSSYVADKLNIEVDILRKYLKIESLNHISQTLLLDRYAKSSTRHLVMAELLGVNVSTWEADREEANDDADFQQSMITRAGYLANQFGDDAATNILSFNEQTYSLFKNVIGSDFAADTRETFNKSIFGIEHGATVTSSLSESLNTTLLMLGTDVRDEYILLLEAGRKGTLSGPELDSRLQQFVKLIADGDPLHYVEVVDPNIERAREIAAKARTAPASYLNATRDTIEILSSKVLIATEGADDAVDAVDDFRVSMRKIYNTLTPGFGTTGVALDLFTTALKTLVGVFENQGLAYNRGKPYTVASTLQSTPEKEKGLAVTSQSQTSSNFIQEHIDNNKAFELGRIQTQFTKHNGGEIVTVQDVDITKVNAQDNFMATFNATANDMVTPAYQPNNKMDSTDWQMIMHELELSKISLDETEALKQHVENVDQQIELMDKPRKRGFAPLNR